MKLLKMIYKRHWDLLVIYLMYMMMIIRNKALKWNLLYCFVINNLALLPLGDT